MGWSSGKWQPVGEVVVAQVRLRYWCELNHESHSHSHQSLPAPAPILLLPTPTYPHNSNPNPANAAALLRHEDAATSAAGALDADSNGSDATAE